MAFNFIDIGGAILGAKGRQVVWLILALWLLVTAGAATAITAPKPLGEFDVALYGRGSSLQKDGNMKQAIREMGRIEDPTFDRLSAGPALSPSNGLAI